MKNKLRNIHIFESVSVLVPSGRFPLEHGLHRLDLQLLLLLYERGLLGPLRRPPAALPLRLAAARRRRLRRGGLQLRHRGRRRRLGEGRGGGVAQDQVRVLEAALVDVLLQHCQLQGGDYLVLEREDVTFYEKIRFRCNNHKAATTPTASYFGPVKTATTTLAQATTATSAA